MLLRSEWGATGLVSRPRSMFSLGIAPPRIKIGRHVRYRLADVIEWERRHTRDGAA